jgi:16S rRNA processing protein RimM
MQVVVGRIGKAHGIRGAVTVEVRTDEPEVRFADGAVLVTEPSAVGPLVVSGTTWHAGKLLVRFDGIEDRSAAEALRGTLLSAEVEADARPEDPEEFYDRQLVGLAVITTEGHAVGTLREVAHLPSQDLLVIDVPDGGEALVPFVSAIVTDVDLEGRCITIDPPSGLLPEPT